jgi:hypothetical protein
MSKMQENGEEEER